MTTKFRVVLGMQVVSSHADWPLQVVFLFLTAFGGPWSVWFENL